ncbi:MAG: hypothetical protein K8U57_23045 [Planctomycetes bacterium]|nr:hypothetical protein [Planctomycetota bacterium]
MKTAKTTNRKAPSEADALLELIVRVCKVRSEIVALANDPRTDSLMKLCHSSNGNTSFEIGESSIALSDLLEGATVRYADLVSNARK